MRMVWGLMLPVNYIESCCNNRAVDTLEINLAAFKSGYGMQPHSAVDKMGEAQYTTELLEHLYRWLTLRVSLLALPQESTGQKGRAIVPPLLIFFMK
jgi:hypothetical protein